MNPDTVIVTIFVIACILVVITLVVRAYLQWKVIKAIRDIPEDQKPFAGYSKNTRAIIALVLIAFASYGIYLRNERKNDLYYIKKDRAYQAQEEMYRQQHATNNIISYQFSRNDLLYGTRVVFSVPQLPDGFCTQGTVAYWSADSISSDSRYLSAHASCFIVTPDAISETGTARKEVVIDLQEKIIVNK